MMILNGCAKTVAPIVQIKSDFCVTQESIWLEPKDLENITLIRQNEDFKITIDKFLKNSTINEKEKDQCLPKNN